MMRLELSTFSLDVRFECTEEYANDLEILGCIRDLVFKLENHEGVSLTIVSKPEETEVDNTDEYPIRHD